MGGLSQVSWLSDLRFAFWPANRKNFVFETQWVKKVIFMHIWITGNPIPIPFFPTLLFRYVGGVSQVSWLSDLWFAFWPPNPKNLAFEIIWVKKVIFMHIWITRSPIPIPLLPKTLFRYVGGVGQVSWLSDLRFAFWPPKPQKLSFWKPISWKSCFCAYLDNRESDYDSVSSYNFL